MQGFMHTFLQHLVNASSGRVIVQHLTSVSVPQQSIFPCSFWEPRQLKAEPSSATTACVRL